MNTPRILLAAYQCGSGMGSVSQIGWEWYRRLAQRLPVTLVTHIRNRVALEQANAPLPGTEIIYIDSEWFAGPLYRLAKRLFPRSEHPVFLISSLDFYLYDWLALRKLKSLQQQGAHWDLVHAVTPVSPLAATHLYKLDIPLIVGPWNGGLASPTTFPEIMRAESRWLYPLRHLGRLFDWLAGTTRNARMILTATRSTRATIPARYQYKCETLLENGVDTSLFSTRPWPPEASQLLRIIFVGRLLPFKGVSMLLEAVAKLATPYQLTIVGEGPERANLEQLTDELEIADKVEFTGNLSLPDVAGRMQQAHVFCLPSVRESGGAVLLEAMAVARPVIAIDFGGPAETVDDGIGVKLPATGREDVIQGLYNALTDIIRNPQRWQERGQEGRRRVERYYDWDAKLTQTMEFYTRILNRNHE